MAKNWLLYILALIGTVVFFLFYQMWLAWYCLVILLLIPPIALFVALVSRSGSRFSMVSPKNIKIGDEAILKISVTTRKIATFSLVRMDLQITEKMTGVKTKKRAFVQGSAVMEATTTRSTRSACTILSDCSVFPRRIRQPVRS